MNRRVKSNQIFIEFSEEQGEFVSKNRTVNLVEFELILYLSLCYVPIKQTSNYRQRN